eukprot:m.234786 g.234786  ORF g.234786 m.234786 type:complete len:87 (+) comp26527_c0_seq8:1063-1323(+)
MNNNARHSLFNHCSTKYSTTACFVRNDSSLGIEWKLISNASEHKVRPNVQDFSSRFYCSPAQFPNKVIFITCDQRDLIVLATKRLR